MWSDEESQWSKALSWYPTAIKEYEASSKAKNGLSALDDMLWNDLGEAVAERETSHLKGNEYRRVIEWKLKRGKWRPRLQKFADQLDDNIIKSKSQSAFLSLKTGKLREAIAHLVQLRGCGPATASAVLASCDKAIPFMSDELLVSIPCFKGQRDYSLATYMTLVEEVHLKCEELGADWNARDVERAVFAAAIAQKLDLTDAMEATLQPNVERDVSTSYKEEGTEDNSDGDESAQSKQEAEEAFDKADDSEWKPVTRATKKRLSAEPESTNARQLRATKRRRN